MDESVLPGPCQCPKSILNLLSPYRSNIGEENYGLKWRELCLEHADKTAKARKLKSALKTGDSLNTVEEISVCGKKYPVGTPLSYTKCAAYGVYWTAPDGVKFTIRKWIDKLELKINEAPSVGGLTS